MRLKRLLGLIIILYGFLGLLLATLLWRSGKEAISHLQVTLQQVGDSLHLASLVAEGVVQTMDSGSATLRDAGELAAETAPSFAESGQSLLAVAEQVKDAGELLKEIGIPTLTWRESKIGGVQVIGGLAWNYEYPLAPAGVGLEEAGDGLQATGEALLTIEEGLKETENNLGEISQDLADSAQQVQRMAQDMDKTAQEIKGFAGTPLLQRGLAIICTYLVMTHLTFALTGIAIMGDRTERGGANGSVAG